MIDQFYHPKQYLIMMLIRLNLRFPLRLNLRFPFSLKPPPTKGDSLLSKDGRIFFDIPSYNTSGKFKYKINEDMPVDANDFSLRGLNVKYFEDTADFNKIPKLHHGLNKLLDGKIYEGHMGFGRIPEVKSEVIAQMSDYVPPSQDKNLQAISEEAKCKYSSSTSNISIPLIHLYFLFSMFRRPNFESVYEVDTFEGIKKEHMNHFKKPSTFYITRRTPTAPNSAPSYSIDADKGYSEEKSNQVLLETGTLAEYLLTNSKQTIEQIIRTGVVSSPPQSYYRYCAVNNNILLRSQIDCRDIDQNGNPFVFQIKTRAVCPIRYDIDNWRLYKDYPINTLRGNFQSFEREYYDLIRGAFLKYAFQLKIGRMHGAFVAYHNTEDVYGYEYVPFKEIVLRLFGDQYNMEASFQVTCRMLTQIFDYILQDTKEYDYNQLKVGFYANSVTKSLNVMVEVMHDVREYPSVLNHDGIQEYFQKHVKQLKNPVFKYDFSFYTFLNGVLVRHPQVYYRSSDNIKMKWKIKKFGRIQREEYINFLREAYKEDFIFGSHKYYGMWVETHKIKEWL